MASSNAQLLPSVGLLSWLSGGGRSFQSFQEIGLLHYMSSRKLCGIGFPITTTKINSLETLSLAHFQTRTTHHR